ncbi:MAG: MerR family transcriptional regulator [Firmicutes bacterium]|nr:MerR family transcriptional regulator [Bacillota bacterium]
MDMVQYRIGELAEKAGVTRRTIHYYLGRGLLPSPDGAGLGTTYSDEHLQRIMLIKKLQDNYLPLEEIKKRIVGMSLEDVVSSLDEQVVMEVVASEYRPKMGTSYERVAVGQGVEIHFPVDNEKALDLVEKLYQYAESLVKEG